MIGENGCGGCYELQREIERLRKSFEQIVHQYGSPNSDYDQWDFMRIARTALGGEAFPPSAAENGK